MCPMSVDRARGSFKSSRASRVLAEVGNTNSDLSRTCTNCASMDKMVFKHGPCVNNKTESAIHINEEPFTSFYTVEKEIGRGKFAVVKKCQHKATGIDYAAKYLRKRRKGKDSRAEILREIEMLQVALVHPRLVDLVEVYETSHDIILVTEYAAGGELFNHVIMEEGFKERDVIRLMKQVLEGLIFLHNQNIVHLDVKPSNILLTDTSLSGNIKLCDFGFARRLTAGEDFRDIIGTPDYVAPEVLSYESINMASDMWSMGVLAYVMLTGHSPFAGDNNQETFLNISQVNLEFPDDLFADVSEEAQDFITRLLVREPRQRLTAVQCLQHPWLKEDGIEASSSQASTAALPTKSPFGSPVGHRRARTPPSPETSPGVGPLKKCKSDEDYNETCTKKDNDPEANEPADVEVIAVSELEFNATAIPHRTDCRSSSVPNSPFVTKKETCTASVNSVPASPVVLKRLYKTRDNMSDLWGKLEETAASVCV